MDHPVLQYGATGDNVAAFQDLLNRNGAILDEDGQFGQGTEDALREAQAALGLPVTGIADAASWVALAKLPVPNGDISTRAVAFIGFQEVGSRAYYDRVACYPDFPGEQSGITIGIGYDLKEEPDFVDDWSPYLPPSVIATLQPWIGQPGTQAGVQTLHSVNIPWKAAWSVFIKSSLPQNVTATRGAFQNFGNLPPLARGMLVSLVYNRGTAMQNPPGDTKDSRLEMRQIQSAMAASDFPAIPQFFENMTRLWPGDTDLQNRRIQEAKLFALSLAQTI